ncbi:hypothetical protein FA13DRAFT_541596 [Coprinellus micaceus]|uniref:DNA2/NAM7 helicase-like C-terminal domain-containing protein n=1 Tax=Coprinellus micaceus TaxID=71717 RepID=A0A4Y7T8K8_COPMI|nr:hypothetical protein FA13DRAFT_541596 [Coprinellus micaceus]
MMGGHTVIQLTENFRLNPDLGEFVATIYSRQFKPQKAQSRSLAPKLTGIVHMSEANKGTHDLGVNRNVLRTVQVFLLGLSDVMLRRPQSVLKPPRFSGLKMPIAEMEDSPTDPNHQPVSLSLLRLRTWSSTVGQQFGYETHVHGEAALTASLVAALRYCTPDDDIFVATPHRVQREAVKTALARLKRPDQPLEDRFERLGVGEQNGYLQNVTVDTVERLQGSEASFVICLFSLPELHSADLGFLLGRRRLNVAISRAKTLCILITSTQVLCPPVSVFANEETGKGYAFLKAYEDRAWSYDVSVDVGAL